MLCFLNCWMSTTPIKGPGAASLRKEWACFYCLPLEHLQQPVKAPLQAFLYHRNIQVLLGLDGIFIVGILIIKQPAKAG